MWDDGIDEDKDVEALNEDDNDGTDDDTVRTLFTFSCNDSIVF